MITERQRRYVERHPERVRAAKRKWNKSPNGVKIRGEWQRSNAGRAWFRAEYHRLRGIVIDAYGGKCACCSEAERRFLAIDHVNGGGHKERRRIGSGAALYNKIIGLKFPPEYQVLCHNCNMAKGLYGQCPHKGAP